VSDQGPGIAADAQARIFERFYRVDEARTRDAGAGLGLALARWIAQAHDGEVALAASSRVGSTFVITLPSPSERARPRLFSVHDRLVSSVRRH
jgi:signal transduction histidine kinase